MSELLKMWGSVLPESNEPITHGWLLRNEFNRDGDEFWLYVGDCCHIGWRDGKVTIMRQTIEDEMPLPGEYRLRGQLWMLFDALQIEMKRKDGMAFEVAKLN